MSSSVAMSRVSLSSALSGAPALGKGTESCHSLGKQKVCSPAPGRGRRRQSQTFVVSDTVSKNTCKQNHSRTRMRCNLFRRSEIQMVTLCPVLLGLHCLSWSLLSGISSPLLNIWRFHKRIWTRDLSLKSQVVFIVAAAGAEELLFFG